MQKITNFLPGTFSLGTIAPGILYAVPFTTAYSNKVISITTSYSFGSPRIGIYSNKDGFPANLLVEVISKSQVGEQHIYNVELQLPRDSYYVCCVIDRATNFLGRAGDDPLVPSSLPLYDADKKIGGLGWSINHAVSLPPAYPANARLIPFGEFCPFFLIDVEDFSASGGSVGVSGVSGFSGASNGVFNLIVNSLGL